MTPMPRIKKELRLEITPAELDLIIYALVHTLPAIRIYETPEETVTTRDLVFKIGAQAKAHQE